MSARADAIVIGAGIGGLVAAATLKRAGRSVILLEAEECLGGRLRRAQALFALDPRVVKELGLSARGLKFSARDMPTVALRQDGRHLTLPRDPHQAARAIAAHSPGDADAYKRYHAEIFAAGRALRAWWWEGAASQALPRELETVSAAHYLAARFESEALRQALCFDVALPNDPGSALALAWRASQEMCGQQGALAMPQAGLADMLVATAQDLGVEIRAQARVAKLILDGGAVAGAELASGEQVFARIVLSSLTRRATLLDMAPTASAGFAQTWRLMRALPRERETAFVFTLNAEPGFGHQGARIVIAEGEPPLEAIASSPSPGQHVLAVRAKGEAEEAKVIAQLERYAPQLGSRIVARTRAVRDVPAPRLMDDASARMGTPVAGLYLCGADAEPMDAPSGRAGRLAAVMSLGEKGA